MNSKAGFTLAELAISLTIIGLLLGGVLMGQRVILSARISATVSQVNEIESDTTAFKDQYGYLPGDMPSADVKIKDCTEACKLQDTMTDVDGVYTTGDGRVGLRQWLFFQFQGASISPSDLGAGPEPETVLFWYELMRAGYRVVVNDDGIRGEEPSFGGSLPVAKIGGGFWVGYAGGVATPTVWDTNLFYSMSGTVLMLVGANENMRDSEVGSFYDGLPFPLTPAMASEIDIKLDDGVPISGRAQAYGPYAPLNSGLPTCVDGDQPTPTDPIRYFYSGAYAGKSCAMIFSIGK